MSADYTSASTVPVDPRAIRMNVIGGELCEWADAEHVRDAAQFGEQKTLLILGHAGSEKSAMEALARSIDGKYDGAEARYFDCGELYTY